jgi:type I restriction enzyme M protein
VKPRLTLRDDGMSYGDYVEQLTYLLFLKLADERSLRRCHQPSALPSGSSCQRLPVLSQSLLA